MKKILMSMVALFAAVTMNAQNEMYVGGTLNFQTKANVANKSVITVAPEIGMSLNEQFGVGAVLSYTASQDVYNAFTINPYLRYNLVKLDKVNLFVDGGFDFTNTKYHSYKNNTWGIGVKPGVAVNLNENISFVAHMGFLGYRSSKDDTDGAKATNTVGLNLDGTDLSFGFYYNF